MLFNKRPNIVYRMGNYSFRYQLHGFRTPRSASIAKKNVFFFQNLYLLISQEALDRDNFEEKTKSYIIISNHFVVDRPRLLKNGKCSPLDKSLFIG